MVGSLQGVKFIRNCTAVIYSVTRGWFVQQKLMLRCSFRCDQIHNSQYYESGHTIVLLLKSDLDVLLTHLICGRFVEHLSRT